MSLAATLPTGATAVRAETATVAVSLENVSKRFPARRTWREILRAPFAKTYTQALTDVNLTVYEGEFFGLLGPNGAGKSTLFKTLATLVLPDTGRLIVNGVDVVANPREVRRHLVPVVADERTLRWRLDARENLRLFAVLYRIPPKDVWKRVDEVLEVVSLANTGAKLVGQFSTGMKQRLLIARALLARPRVLLLDEPTRGLDPISARSMRGFLKDEICHRQGCTVLLATHSAEEAFHLCDRVGVLDRGRLLRTGRAVALADAFANDRFRIWTRAPLHGAVALLVDRGVIAQVETPRPDGDGWFVVDLKIPGGADAAAGVLRTLVTSGVELARFERVQLSLAELIEREQLHARESVNA
jgi:ABC-type multidrug transport system ATPase subunit